MFIGSGEPEVDVDVDMGGDERPGTGGGVDARMATGWRAAAELAAPPASR